LRLLIKAGGFQRTRRRGLGSCPRWGGTEGSNRACSNGQSGELPFNEYYKTEEEFLFALADALREEDRAVVSAGFVLQIDDPGLPDWWDMLKPEPTIETYRKFAKLRIDAVNHALVGIPEERVRYHLCWGSWHGPHTHDLPLEHIIDLILEVKAQTYSFEAGNVRHEHEWRVWQQAKLPAGKMLMPGVVSHATNLVEHPRLVADRILRYAAIAGRENIVAGTDCGLGGRVHADVLATGKTRQELYLACPNDRPNHVGIAVQRHLRAGRIQERDGKLYAASPGAQATA